MANFLINYKPLLDDAYAQIGPSGPPNTIHGLQMFMPVYAVREYMARFLDGNFTSEVRDILSGTNRQPPTASYRNSFYDSYRATGSDRLDVRGVKEYLLTYEEVLEAERIYKANPLLTQTIATVQAGVYEYFREMQIYHATEYRQFMNPLEEPYHPQVDALIKEYTKFGALFSFIHDMMPAVALSLSKSDWVPKDGLTAYVFQRGAATAIRKGAFQSQDSGGINRCPFSKIFGPLFSTVLEYREGHIVVSDEEYPGALPEFVAKRIRQLEQTSGMVLNPAIEPSM